MEFNRVAWHHYVHYNEAFCESRTTMMNKVIIQIILSSLLLLFTLTNCLGALPELVRCHVPSKKSNNIQCIYSVTGQKINNSNKTSRLYVNTDMLYASCAHVLCNINPKKTSSATCICPVIGANEETQAWKKLSVGPIFFEINHEKYYGEKLKQVAANFSLADRQQPSTLKGTHCQFDQPIPWAYCFGRQCQVYYQSKNNKTVPMAKCNCKIIKTNSFVIAGSDDPNECKTPPDKVWSAATEKQTKNMADVILDSYKRFHPQIISKNKD